MTIFKVSPMVECKPEPKGFYARSPEEKLNDLLNLIREFRVKSDNPEIEVLFEKSLEIAVR